MPRRGHTSVGAWLRHGPLNADWMKRIEVQFAGLRCFALDRTEHLDCAAEGRMVRRYIALRNRNAGDPTSAASSTRRALPDRALAAWSIG